MSRDIALPMRVVQRLMGGCNVGGIKLRGGRERLYGCVVAQDEIEHAGQKMRVGGGRAQRLRADPAFGQKRTQTFGVPCDEGEGLNCNDFSHFPGVVNRLFQLRYLPFRNLWSLFWGHHARVCGMCSSKWMPLRVKMARGFNGLERIWR